MRVREMQEAVDAWIRDNGGYWEVHWNMLRLSEEVGELARAVNHELGPKKKKPTEAERELAGEVGDVLWILLCLANQLDVDLEDELERTLEKLRVRDAGRHTGGEGA